MSHIQKTKKGIKNNGLKVGKAHSLWEHQRFAALVSTAETRAAKTRGCSLRLGGEVNTMANTFTFSKTLKKPLQSLFPCEHLFIVPLGSYATADFKLWNQGIISEFPPQLLLDSAFA